MGPHCLIEDYKTFQQTTFVLHKPVSVHLINKTSYDRKVCPVPDNDSWMDRSLPTQSHRWPYIYYLLYKTFSTVLMVVKLCKFFLPDRKTCETPYYNPNTSMVNWSVKVWTKNGY